MPMKTNKLPIPSFYKKVLEAHKMKYPTNSGRVCRFGKKKGIDIIITKDEFIIERFKDKKRQHPENSHVTAGRLGGLKGGHARAKVLTPEERSAIARKAVMSRWNKKVDK